MKRIIMLITAIAVMIGLAAPAANASEPIVDLSGIQYSAASFETDASAAASASLKTKTGTKVVLNVNVNPMPKTQIKRCWSVKPGTVIWNEVIDPATGTKKVIRWTVPANDNVFCYKKGAGKQVFKKSCGNRVWGVPGGPKNPPSSLPRIKVKVSIQDYLTWKGELTYKGKQSGSAMAHVVQYDGDRKVCEAQSSVSGSISVDLKMYISVRSRTRVGISAAATNQVKVKASTSTTVAGTLKYEVDMHLEGKAMAMCDVPPQPPTFDQPDIDVAPVACVNPGEVRTVMITVTNPNNIADIVGGTFNGQALPEKSVAAGGQVTYSFPNLGAGAYNGVVTLQQTAKSAGFSINVEACPVVDNPPSMQCQGPQHIFVGDDAMFADFDLTDPDGNIVSFSEPVVTGPLEVVLVEDTTISGGKRRTVGIRAAQISDGTSQNATLKVTGSAGGKSVSCTVNIIVENNQTGW